MQNFSTYPKPEAVLFDWDNTLVDTWPSIHDALNHTLEAMGEERWSFAETKDRVRKSAREAFPELFGERSDAAMEIFYARFEQSHIRELVALEGAQELLQTLQNLGIYTAVVSNKTGKYLREEAEHLGWTGYFAHLVGATDAEKDKPDPAPVRMALEGSEIRPGENVWFVGDTNIDMHCAYNCGLLPVLVHPDKTVGSNFADFPPKIHVQSCEALSRLVHQG